MPRSPRVNQYGVTLELGADLLQLDQTVIRIFIQIRHAQGLVMIWCNQRRRPIKAKLRQLRIDQHRHHRASDAIRAGKIFDYEACAAGWHRTAIDRVALIDALIDAGADRVLSCATSLLSAGDAGYTKSSRGLAHGESG